MVGWAFVTDAVPIYPLYALLFTDAGVSEAGVSGLLVVWSVAGILAELPTGALADRWSRRGALVLAGLLQAAAYVGWIVFPGVPGFAAGFAIWAVGGALVSGAQEALLHDGLAAAGVRDRYARVQGWVEAAVLLSALPGAAAASALFPLGGYDLVGWASVAVCLAAAGLASRLPEPPRDGGDAEDAEGEGDEDDDGGYLATLRAGLAEAMTRPGLRTAVLAAAVLGGLDAVEEFFPLLARDGGVPTGVVPVAMLGIPLAGALGAAAGGWAARLRPAVLTGLLVAALAVLALAGSVRHPAALAGISLFYGLYRMVLVVVDARLQARIRGSARATVTSVAGLGLELAGLAVFGIWAAGGPILVAALWAVAAAALRPAATRP
jgi:MFS family permease